jgi:predicted xylose isomerase-like sugar epimerase
MSSSYDKGKHGNDLPQAKLTPLLVIEIRRRNEEKQRRIAELNAKYSAKAMADDLGVHVRTIEKVLRYESWRHVA